MTELKFRALFPFCGLGAGARGFLDAAVELFGTSITFECLGGIDLDPEACKDFEAFTGVPAWCADVGALTGAMVRARYGSLSPDCVFLSPPCKGASALLPAELARTKRYREMNALALRWMETMIEAWPDDPPKLVLLENVPRLSSRAASTLRKVRSLLRKAGYAIHEGYHCCGELGGLAQKRRRYLMVARRKDRCPELLYRPPRRRVRACGEVLEALPVPATPDAEQFGRMHELPRIALINWLRLSLIPAGGDWRDLDGVLAEGQPRRELFKRQEGANAIGNVADPRVGKFGNVDRVRGWDQAVGTITGSPAPSSGAPAVGDPRLNWFKGVLGVRPWEVPAPTVTGRAGVSTGTFAVADPRRLPFKKGRHWNKWAVGSWDAPARAVISKVQPGSGGPSVADPRVKRAYDAGYAVLRWDQAARTIAGTTAVGCGAYAVADPREGPMPSRADDVELALRTLNPDKAPPFLPIIIAKDGSWHRPLTTIELAVLQGIPHILNGRPLVLVGRSQSRWRERIGNAVPVPTARAIAERMLATLAASLMGDEQADGGDVWVVPDGHEVDDLMLERTA
jgi:site-specific DNA-cytosine methylase